MSLRADCAAIASISRLRRGLQAAGSTVESKEPNILANYLRA